MALPRRVQIVHVGEDFTSDDDVARPGTSARIQSPLRCFATSGGFYFRRSLMDAQTVIVTCEIILVAIGIAGLILAVRR